MGRGDTERQKREGREEETAGKKSEEYTCIHCTRVDVVVHVLLIH